MNSVQANSVRANSEPGAYPLRSRPHLRLLRNGGPFDGHHQPVTAPATMTDARRVTREVFGHDELFPGQREAVEAVLEGRDVLFVSSPGGREWTSTQAAGGGMKGVQLGGA